MAKGKITYEEDYERKEMTFRKSYGRLTIQDLIDTMQSQDFLWAHEGKLFIWDFCPSEHRYDDYGFYTWKPEDGDSVSLLYVEDEQRCPICGTKRYLQYCPDCGRKLTMEG